VSIHLLVVNPQLDFIVKLKKALERTGAYIVHPFTSGDTALDYIRQHPQDVALVDFRVSDMTGPQLVEQLRIAQPDLAIVASPSQGAEMLNRLGLQGAVDTPIQARELMPILESALAQMRQLTRYIEDTETLHLTRRESPITTQSNYFEDVGSAGVEGVSSLDAVLVKLGAFGDMGETIEFEVTETAAPPAESSQMSVFERLAAEEPPMPTLEESGTLSDLKVGVSDAQLREVLSLMKPADIARRLPTVPTDDPTDESSAAQWILQTALDETTPIDVAIDKIEQQLKLALGYDPNHPPEYSAPNTEAVQPFETQPSRLETERYTQPELPVQVPPVQAPVVDAPPIDASITEPLQQVIRQTEEMSAQDAQQLQDDFDRLASFVVAGTMGGDAAATEPQTDPSTQSVPHEDAEITRMAVLLTQASLDITAEATVLSRHGEIAAYAGKMPREDLEELRPALADATNPQSYRVRFVTLLANGKDYMVYSRRTAGDFTLSMIFAGTLPIPAIKRQEQRILSALYHVPEAIELSPTLSTEAVIEAHASVGTPSLDVPMVAEAPAGDAPAPIAAKAVSTVPLSPHTYVWLLRDPSAALSQPLMQAIAKDLGTYLGQWGWQVRSLNVYEDYVYVVAGVPGEPAHNEIIRELKARSAQSILVKHPDLDTESIWVDGYLIVTPGRELTVEEIQHYINFERTA
jgi:CheY-like chemotaxis protein